MTGFLTIGGPTLAIGYSGLKMTEIASANTSEKKKSAKDSLTRGLKYGLALGMLGALTNLITSFGPFTTCIT
jgi:hypothetical protein